MAEQGVPCTVPAGVMGDCHRGDHRIVPRSVLCLLLLAFTHVRGVEAKEFRIEPGVDLKPVLKQVRAGDSIVMTDGTWTDSELRFERLAGTRDAPITIRAQSPGGVVLTGAVTFRVSGDHVVVSGLVFRNAGGSSNVFEFRTHSERHAHHSRITDCCFEQTTETTQQESRWLNVYGTHNRVDHCYLAGKRNRGPSLVVWVGETPGRHRIDHNHFGPRPELGRNGGETIRIGTSDTSERDCLSIVEENYFDRCNGEGEIISNKSCGNIYRHNLFERCEGALTLRHGHRCLVDGNVFLGRTVRGTGGVRIIGSQHRVVNNYFEGLRGDAERSGICFMNGLPNSPLNGYAPVRDALVAHNTLIDCKVSMEFGVRSGENLVAASNCVISHNVFVPTKWELFRVHAKPVDFVWKHNKLQSGQTRGADLVSIETVDIDLTRSSDGLLRPMGIDILRVAEGSGVENDIDGGTRQSKLAGCDDPENVIVDRHLVTDTGPRWKTE
ncbi:MAG: polysaccharide lyase 6 family protein [Planctomycetota bacterium]